MDHTNHPSTSPFVALSVTHLPMTEQATHTTQGHTATSYASTTHHYEASIADTHYTTSSVIPSYTASISAACNEAVVEKSEKPLATVSHYIEKQKEVITEVPRQEVIQVDHHVEVPGEIVELPRKVLVDTHVVVPRYIDEVVPTVIAQRLEPVIREASEEDGIFVDVKCRVVTFKPVQVDIHVPLPVNRELVAKGKYEQHREINPAVVPAEQYNALVKSLNSDTPLEHILPLFQVTPEVSRRIARRDYQGISAVGAIPCASGPGAAFVEVAEDTPIFPSGARGYDSPQKVFPGAWPSADGWKQAEQANKHLIAQQKVHNESRNKENKPEHRYRPYNYKFSSNSHFDPSLAEPFHVHHHIGKEIHR